MKVRLVLVTIIFLVFGCKKAEQIVLTYPINGAEVKPWDIEFQWSAPKKDEFNLQVSTSPDFDNLVLDTVTTQTTFRFKRQFQPERTYYWRVFQEDRVASSQFKVRDFAKDFEGSHYGSMHYVFWSMYGGILDERDYPDTLILSKTGEEVLVEWTQSGLSYNTHYTPYHPPGHPEAITYQWGGGSNYCRLFINVKNDSISADIRSGGLGAGAIYEFEALD